MLNDLNGQIFKPAETVCQICPFKSFSNVLLSKAIVSAGMEATIHQTIEGILNTNRILISMHEPLKRQA
jgi:hypothetical protein